MLDILRKIINNAIDIQKVCELEISTYNSKIKVLNEKKIQVVNLIEQLKSLLKQKRLDGKIITRETLFSLLRKEAVIQKKIIDSKIEIQNIDIEILRVLDLKKKST